MDIAKSDKKYYQRKVKNQKRKSKVWICPACGQVNSTGSGICFGSLGGVCGFPEVASNG